MAGNKYIEQRFQDHNEWIKSIEVDHKDTQRRVTTIETNYAGMAEAIKGLAEDMKDFKIGLQAMAAAMENSSKEAKSLSKDTNNRLLWGFLGIIAVGVIAVVLQIK